jgi:hypothetical protein
LKPPWLGGVGKNKLEGRGLVGTSTWREKEGEKGDPGAAVGSGPRPSAAGYGRERKGERQCGGGALTRGPGRHSAGRYGSNSV